MFIIGLGTAAPAQRYAQTECWTALESSSEFGKLAPRSRAILKKVLLGKNGITARHLALDSLSDAFEISPDVLHARFARHAPSLATAAAERALQSAGTVASEIDALIISTCTGYLCPGLTSYVAQRLGLRGDVLPLDLVGQGCGAALPNLRTGENLIRAGRCRRVLSVCVEICTAAFYLDDDPGVLISACLFGDGAAAAVLSDEPCDRVRRVEWKASGSLLAPADRELLRFDHRNGMLRNILSPDVPGKAAEHAETVLNDVLNAAGVSRGRIENWILHAGGKDVLLALREHLGLTEQDICWSARVLNDFGNLSSPFVLFVLKFALEENAPGGLWWLSSFGAGFTSHGALLEVGE